MLSTLKKHIIAGSLLKHTSACIKRLWTKARRKADYVIGLTARKLVYARGKIQKDKIFVTSFDGNYSCNPRYIVEEIIRQKLPVDIVWSVSPTAAATPGLFPPEVRLVITGSYTMFEEQASAKVWLDNALNCVWHGMPKKKGQVYFNTWHGSMGIKKLHSTRVWMYRAKRCNKQTDYCISNSRFEDDVFRGSFWRDIPSLPYGHPRNDVLFDKAACAALKETVHQFFFPPLAPCQGQAEAAPGPAKRLFLYAPTFRDHGTTDVQDVDYARLKAALEARFGGEWVILVRMHFKDRARKTGLVFSDWLKDASVYADMQELLAVVDAGMTDYSSWAYDYVLTRKPLFLYAPDLADYDQNRGFYYPLESTPFPLCQNNDELDAAIRAFDDSAYQSRVNDFLTDKGCYEDGNASRRTVEKLKEVMGLQPNNEEQTEQ